MERVEKEWARYWKDMERREKEEQRREDSATKKMERSGRHIEEFLFI